MNEPGTRNALTNSLITSLRHELRVAKEDPKTRCVILSSTHPTSFCAGGDLNDFTADITLLERHRRMDGIIGLYGDLESLGKPVIAAVNGQTLAGGMGLVLACDLVVAAESAQFGCPEISIGAFPFMVSAMLARAVGKFRASQILMLGERMSAHSAAEMGLVNRVLATQDFESGVDEWARRLATRSPLILGMGKDALLASRDMSMPDALSYLHSQLTLALSTADLHEGVTAFFERREPVWSGR